MAYAKINSVENANMAKIDSLAKSSCGKISSIEAPASFADSFSVLLDGSNDYITTGAGGGSNTQDFTISWWMRAAVTGGNRQVWSFGSSGGFPICGFGLNQMGGTKPLITYGNSRNRRFVADDRQDDDAWHHWMVFVDASSPTGARLFIDGSEIAAEATSNFNTTPTFANLEIGRDAFANFEGYINDFAVFTGDKSGDASAHYNSGTPTDLSEEDDLLLYYLFEENTGTSIADSSSNSNTGTLVNGAAFNASTP